MLMIVLCRPSPAEAQQLLLSGKIYYEKKENLHKLYKDGNRWEEEMKKRSPKFRTDVFELTFNLKQSVYKLYQEDETPTNNFWSGKLAAANTVFNDYSAHKTVAEKLVYEMEYRIEDSLPAITWKMLGEYREIAGFNCRKAAAVMYDSLYVIAFYTDQIPVSGGPESFIGLPGMILGVVVPRLNITYFATKIEGMTPSEKELTFVPKRRTRQVNRKMFSEEILKAVEDWGEHKTNIYFKAVL